MDETLVVVTLLSIYLIGFISGFGTRAIISQVRRYKALKAREARHTAQVDYSAHRGVSAQSSEKIIPVSRLPRSADSPMWGHLPDFRDGIRRDTAQVDVPEADMAELVDGAKLAPLGSIPPSDVPVQVRVVVPNVDGQTH